MQIWIAILTSTAAAALITQIGELIRSKSSGRRKAAEADAKAMAALREGLKWVLYDRIRYLGQAYLREGEIDFDDRRLLGEMHKAYHDGLGGNGDLDTLMQSVNDLPLKK